MRPAVLLGCSLALALPSFASAGGVPRLATQDPDQPLLVRPSVVSYTGDGTGYLGGRTTTPRHFDSGSLHWLYWKPARALARGFDWINNCRPFCARGTFHRFRATVRAWRPRHGRFTRMTIKARIGGRIRYDHRRLIVTPASSYEGEYFPTSYSWGICGLRFTPDC